MKDQIKITQEEDKAISNVLAFYHHRGDDNPKESFIRDFVKLGNPVSVAKLLDRFTLEDYIGILYKENYVIVETPHDILLRYYNDKVNSCNTFDQSRAKVVKDVLKILNISVSGINDFHY